MSSRSFLNHSVVEYLRSAEADWASEENADPTLQIPMRQIMLVGASLVESTMEGLTASLMFAKRHNTPRVTLEEMLLQSYLFLGFPRMITGLEALTQVWPVSSTTFNPQHDLVSLAPVPSECNRQWQSGIENGRKVYGSRFDDLAVYMRDISPTLLSWMIFEGYGKVLSRPGLSLTQRELLSVSMLLLEERERQLFAHVRGAMNTGVTVDSLHQFVSLHQPFSENGCAMAKRIIDRLVIS